MKKALPFLLFFALAPALQAQERRPESVADLAERLLPTVVNISTIGTPEENEELSVSAQETPLFSKGDGHVSLGSGFLIDETGYIITNNHVISGAVKVMATTAENKTYEASIAGADEKTDLALIKIEGQKPFPYARLGDSDKIRIGDWILAIGNPFGLGGSVTAGIISAKSRDIESGPYDNFIQTDASINQGNSGGPMFNMQGEVIGINSAIYSTSGGSMGVGFALPVNLSKFVIQELKQKGKVERGWLGLKVQPMTEDIAASQNMEKTKGVLVSDVAPNSPAAAAGIEAGDILLTFGDDEILQARDFSRMVAETLPGTEKGIIFRRNKEQFNKKIKIEKMPEAPQTATAPSAGVSEKEGGVFLEDLDLRIADITPDLQDKYQLEPGTSGVVVLEAVSGSDAALKGIREGDVIIQMDKAELLNAAQMKELINEAKRDNRRPVLLMLKNNELPNFVALKLKGKANAAY